jgi:hypothetical protein
MRNTRLPAFQRTHKETDRRLFDQERRIRKPPPPEPELVPFSWAGPVEISESGPYRPLRRGRLTSVLVSVGVVGTGDTVLLIKKNGATIVEVTLPAGEESILANASMTFSIKIDALNVEVTGASDAENLTVQARFV